MTSNALKIQVQGNAVFVNGVTYGRCEKYKGDRVRLWLHNTAADFTILDNTPNALRNFVIARRAAIKNMKA